MLLYVLLDWSTDIILWLVKNLGLASYYSVCYILGYSTENGETEQTQQLKELITNHYNYTQSALAQRILENWDAYLPKFIKVLPEEYRQALIRLEEEEKLTDLTE